MPKLGDYRVLDFFIRKVALELDLTKAPVQSKAHLTVEQNPNGSLSAKDLHLDCEHIKLIALALNGKILSPEEYELEDHQLIIKNVPKETSFQVEIISQLGENTDLFGLYKTEGTALVKAETEGLRRVFPCIDRPDNLAEYVTTIIASKQEYPALLSNGVLIAHHDLANGIHSVTWHDPIPKPSYLFAMVAGDLKCVTTSYKTQRGREIPIEFYIPKEDIKRSLFAQKAIQNAIQYDEEYFNLECPLPLLKIAGVNKYASGASEPTGLILFNTANLLGTEASRTDHDLIRILDVVAHEYFHTWTGNLVTIRDWFNLCVKEGLTTLRASLFLEQSLGVDLARMFERRSLDARAPRPEAYTAVRSLYTAAAYEKSAEIFRMIMNAMGRKKFHESLSAFLQKNKGNAVTLENILHYLSKKSGQTLSSFLSWFSESGVPKVTVRDEYNAETHIYKLKFTTTDAKHRLIPIKILLFDKSGAPLSQEEIIILEQPETECTYENIPQQPIPSLLRGLSAPVTLEYEYTNEQLLVLMQYDGDVYNQCNSVKILITRMVQKYCTGTLEFSSDFTVAYLNLLLNNQQPSWALAELLTLPTEEALIASLPNINFEKIAEARRVIQQKLGMELKLDLHRMLAELSAPIQIKVNTLFDMNAAGNRRLKYAIYSLLLAAEPKATEEALIREFNLFLATNMTETCSALTLLANINSSELNQLLERFYTYWKHDINAINYWFNLQAAAHSTTVVNRVAELMQHEAFDLSNPNKVSALLGAFINNPYGFHAISGAGYKLVASVILEVEQFNPTLAARLTEQFNGWGNIEKKRQELMLNSLSYIYQKAISVDVRSIAKKELEKANVQLPSQQKPQVSHPHVIQNTQIHWDFFADETSQKPSRDTGKKGEEDQLFFALMDGNSL